MTDKLYTQAELDEQLRLAQAAALKEAARIADACERDGVAEPGVISACILAPALSEQSLLAQHDAELRAEAGAAMEKLITSEWPHDYVKNENGEPVIERLCEDHRRHLRALIPTNYAATLDRLIAKARLEGIKREQLARLLFEVENKPGDAEWPEDWARQPYCRWALRNADKILATLRAEPAELRRAVEGATDVAGKEKSNE